MSIDNKDSIFRIGDTLFSRIPNVRELTKIASKIRYLLMGKFTRNVFTDLARLVKSKHEMCSL